MRSNNKWTLGWSIVGVLSVDECCVRFVGISPCLRINTGLKRTYKIILEFHRSDRLLLILEERRSAYFLSQCAPECIGASRRRYWQR